MTVSVHAPRCTGEVHTTYYIEYIIYYTLHTTYYIEYIKYYILHTMYYILYNIYYILYINIDTLHIQHTLYQIMQAPPAAFRHSPPVLLYTAIY